MYKILIVVVVCLLANNVLAVATSQGDYYVSVNRLSVRLGPSLHASITNTLDRNQKIKVFEVQNGWARISQYYEGAKEGKRGPVARWVSAKYLSKRKSTGSSASSSLLEKAIKGSDDFAQYRHNFIEVSGELVQSGKCSLADYKNWGGWTRSVTHRPKPIYFTYCGGMSKNNKVYINAQKGEVYR